MPSAVSSPLSCQAIAPTAMTAMPSAATNSRRAVRSGRVAFETSGDSAMASTGDGTGEGSGTGSYAASATGTFARP